MPDTGIISTLLNGNLFSALAGALAGALAAVYIGLRVERQKQKREEILAVNKALMLCAAIVNGAFIFMRQHAHPQKVIYEKQCKDRLEHRQRVAEGLLPPGSPFEYEALLRSFPTIRIPIDNLNALLMTRIGSDKALLLATHLEQTIAGFHEVIAERNRLIETIRNGSEDRVFPMYFGLRDAGGRTDENYRGLMEGVYINAESILYFAMLMIDILRDYGQHLIDRFGRNPPKLQSADFEPIRSSGLMPDPKDYQSFEVQFRPKPSAYTDAYCITM
ncbi:MAG TPA: hypothetical protein VHU23_11935 [Rhizomicrobium sp.]|jgi:hypothetical protein|nr:hypothetical protein [Rhizomicrobium sp.]